MLPIFNKNCDLIGWTDMKFLYDQNINLVAYINCDNYFSYSGCNWLGSINGLNFLDTNGKVIGWNPSCSVSGTCKPYTPAIPARPARPATPAHPATPATPAKPCTPIGGWSSKLSF